MDYRSKGAEVEILFSRDFTGACLNPVLSLLSPFNYIHQWEDGAIKSKLSTLVYEDQPE